MGPFRTGVKNVTATSVYTATGLLKEISTERLGNVDGIVVANWC